MFGSSEGFLRSGKTIDCLKMVGKVPERREELTMEVSAGSTSRHSTSSGTGMGSRAHDLGVDLVITRSNSSSLTGLNLLKDAVCSTSSVNGDKDAGVDCLTSP